jgi:hypothetical protein
VDLNNKKELEVKSPCRTGGAKIAFGNTLWVCLGPKRDLRNESKAGQRLAVTQNSEPGQREAGTVPQDILMSLSFIPIWNRSLS